MNEVWKDSVFEKYQVSDQGRVRNKETEHCLRFTTSSKGGRYVRIRDFGVQISKPLDKFVLETFGVEPTSSNQRYVLHQNLDISDCRLENLRWASKVEIIQYGKDWDTLSTKKLYWSKKVQEQRTKQTFDNLFQAAFKLELRPLDVQMSISGIYPETVDRRNLAFSFA